MTSALSSTRAATGPVGLVSGSSPLAQRLAQPRRAAPLRGFNAAVLGIEFRRALRNKRSMLFSIAMPVGFYLMFSGFSYANDRAGHGNVSAWIMVSMALYGAVVATSSAGAAVSQERESGWTRQLRLTPLSAAAWILVKICMGLSMSALAVVAVYVVGLFGKADMPAHVWVETGLLAWLCSVVFAAYGLMMSYVIPGENAQQIIGFSNTVLAFLGGLFIPITPGSTIDHISRFTPLWGIAKIAVAPLDTTSVDAWAIVNAVAWLAVFITVAVWRMSKDTRRG